MAPTPGSIHRRPRHDSRIGDLWAWVRRRRTAWTAPAAAAAVGLSERRTRAVVAALHVAGMIDQVTAADHAGTYSAATWIVSAAGRSVEHPPVLVIGPNRSIGVRFPKPGADIEGLRALAAEVGMAKAAKAAGITGRTLRRLLDGTILPAEGDPALRVRHETKGAPG